jgi:hypothetical protein
VREAIHPAAPEHLPSFITAPGNTDVLMVVMAIILLVFVLMVGVLYFRLHALPERANEGAVRDRLCVSAFSHVHTHAYFLDRRSYCLR